MMKRILFSILLIVLTTIVGTAATPTIFQYVSTADIAAAGTGSTVYDVMLPDARAGHSGNTILVAFKFDTGTLASPAVTDAAGNSYTQQKQVAGVNFTYNLYSAVNINSTANDRVKIHFTLAALRALQVMVVEIYNTTATPVDGTPAGQEAAAGGPYNTGNITVSNGSIVYAFGFQGSSSRWDSAQATPITKGTGYTLRTTNTGSGSMSEYKISSGATENPAFTPAPTTEVWGMLGIALLAGGTGTAPAAGMRVLGKQTYSSKLSITSFTSQTATNEGNLLVAGWNGEQTAAGIGNHCTLSISDGSNTWTSEVQGVSDSNTNPATVTEQILDTAKAATVTSNTLILTGTITNATSATFASILDIYEITGAASFVDATHNAFDTSAHVDNQTTANTNPWSGYTLSITPTTDNGLIIGRANQFGGTAQGSTWGSGNHFGSAFGESEDGGGTLFEEDGFAGHVYNPDHIAHTLSITGSATAPGGYTIVAASYKAAAVAANNNGAKKKKLSLMFP